ncbi:hypothetical protein ACC690_39625, partial [Rhizobium johnstonii]
CTEPTAPNRLVPPMTEDAIACSSQPSACVALPIAMREAARLYGVNVKGMIYLAYILSASFAAFVGVLLASRIAIGNA